MRAFSQTFAFVFFTQPQRMEYAGDKVRVTVNGQPLTCAATDENGWVTYIGDAASGRVTAPLGATRFWVSLAGGYMAGQRELVLADWAKPETRYTFDNSAVTETSPLVPGPLRLTYDTTLRARCFSSPLPGSVETSAVFTCAIQPFPAESYVSPVYLPIDYAPLDGSTPQISVSGPSGTIQAGPALDLRYPLDSAASTPLTLHRSGAPDVSGSVVWRALDLGNAPDMHICRDDSLLLTAGTLGQTGTLQIVVLDSSNQIFRTITSAEGERTPVLFNRVGIFHATAYISGVSVGSLTIYVSYVDIKGPIACQVGYTREKYVIVQAPSNEVFFTANIPALMNVGVKAFTAQGVTLRLQALQRGSPVLQVRLGSPTGPVVAQQPVDEFTLESSAVPGIVAVMDSESGQATLRMRPYIPAIIFDFNMFASSSTFYGGVRSFRINTSDTNSPTSEPGFRTENDPETGETIGVLDFTLEVPTNENSYCFSANPMQIDAAASPGNPWVPLIIGAANNNNGCICYIKGLNTLIFMSSFSDEVPKDDVLTFPSEPYERWREKDANIVMRGSGTCDPKPKYTVTLVPRPETRTDEYDMPLATTKTFARFIETDDTESLEKECKPDCIEIAYYSGIMYGIYDKLITGVAPTKIINNPCKATTIPGGSSPDSKSGILAVARIDANGPLAGTIDAFPQYVPMLPRRSGVFIAGNKLVAEPVIAVISGGVPVWGVPSFYGVICGNQNVWKFKAIDAGYEKPYTRTWYKQRVGTEGRVEFESREDSTTKEVSESFAEGRWNVILEYKNQNNDVVAKAEIHSLVVEPIQSAKVAPIPTSLTPTQARGEKFELRADCAADNDIPLDAGIFVKSSKSKARGRVSLDGYPQNEYWGFADDTADMAQVCNLTHAQRHIAYLQGYQKPSVDKTDKLQLHVYGQALIEQCQAEKCADSEQKLKGEAVKCEWQFADNEPFKVFYIDLITPSGDPVNSPVDGGDGSEAMPDGANEFTFSSGRPGILKLKLKAKVTPSEIVDRIKYQVRFAVPNIGDSRMIWDRANRGGKPTVSGGDLLATVTFKVLPTENTGFGRKQADVRFNGTPVDIENYEVFFPKKAHNHPGPGSGITPNWYYYWAGTAVPGYVVSGNFRYGGASPDFGGYVVGSYLNPVFIIYDNAALEEDWDSAGLSANLKGIDVLARTLVHERKHWAVERDNAPGGDWARLVNSGDGDQIPDSVEIAHGLNPREISSFSPAFELGDDQDYWCELHAQEEGGVRDASKDWANPGKQSAVRY